jgi:predicted deacylase
MNFGVEIGTGEKVQRLIEVTLAKETLSLPLFIIHGRKDGPTLAITAGVHGTEYASIEAALRLGRTLNPEDRS